ncbi:MAG TPA: tRNA dihydrouridine synthase DusB [Solimonas sp.]|nr:tRNA dihydrouridine synthase DusB [Solimonas sp.]
MLHIGPHPIDPPLILAPMAGVTDLPFRRLSRRLGAGMAVSEMMSANPALRGTEKSRLRMDHAGEPEPVSVQIAGYDPALMAECARYNVEHGAQIIDINMGCPAKKVCSRESGSALLRDEPLVGRILAAVVQAVEVPVTLKIRTGWARAHRNGAVIARIAEDCGIQALAVHGRTREDHFEGEADYDFIADIRQAVRIPVLANGDVDAPEKAREVLQRTGCAGLLIGRAAQGRPWIFREIAHYLATGETLPPPSRFEVRRWLLEHLDQLYAFYGEGRGLRVARKHIQWYCQAQPDSGAFWASVNRLDDAAQQRAAVEAFFSQAELSAAA